MDSEEKNMMDFISLDTIYKTEYVEIKYNDNYKETIGYRECGKGND